MSLTVDTRQLRGDLLRMTSSFVLLSAPYWWLSRTDFLSRAWFNVDLLIPLALAPVSLTLAAFSLVCLGVLDMAVSQSLTWHFHSPFEFIRSIEFVPAMHLTGYLSAAGLARAGVFAAAGVASLAVARPMRHAVLAATCMLLVVGTVDVLNGSSFISVTTKRPLPGNVGGSAAKMWIASMLSTPEKPLALLSGRRSLTSLSGASEWADAHPDRSILLVIVESMGLPIAAPMREELLSHLSDSQTVARYDIDQFAVRFSGSTTSGELRELCDLEGGNYRALDRQEALDCLPHRLAERGWHTVGLHGFSRRMFMRSAWWPLIGLERTEFAEDLDRPGQPRCGGAFVGICDSELVDSAVRESQAPHSFVYALTLNSHLPLGSVHIDDRLAAVCATSQVGDDVCSLTAVIDVTLDALRNALLRAPRAPLVLVVGDHAPPFSALSSRGQFSQTTVPGFALVPK